MQEKIKLMDSIKSTDYYVHFEQKSYQMLKEYLSNHFQSKVFVLVDLNTRKYCLPIFMEKFGLELDPHILEIPSGEKFKNLSCMIYGWLLASIALAGLGILNSFYFSLFLGLLG